MTKRFDARVLTALSALGGTASTVSIHDKVSTGRLWAPSYARLHASLERLEQQGLIKSHMGTVSYPERGNRRRRYYQVVAS